MITAQLGVWMQRWIEKEKGWGSRKDGCYLYPTRDAAVEGTEKLRVALRDKEAGRGYGPDNPPDEYSAPLGDPIFIQVEQDTAKEVTDAGEIYRQYWIQ